MVPFVVDFPLQVQGLAAPDVSAQPSDVRQFRLKPLELPINRTLKELAWFASKPGM